MFAWICVIGLMLFCGNPESLVAELNRANRLVAATGDIADLRKENVLLDSEVTVSVEVLSIDTSEEGAVMLLGSIRVGDRPSNDFLLPEEREAIVQINKSHSEHTQAIAADRSSKIKGKQIQDANEARTRRLKPFGDAARERKDYYETVRVNVTMKRSEAGDVEKLSKKKRYSCVAKVVDCEMLVQKDVFPVGQLRLEYGGGRGAKPLDLPNRVGMVRATHVRAVDEQKK